MSIRIDCVLVLDFTDLQSGKILPCFLNVLSRLLNKILSFKIHCVTRNISGWDLNILILLISDLCNVQLIMYFAEVKNLFGQKPVFVTNKHLFLVFKILNDVNTL